ncbi:hypothetical protein ABE82_01040 [Paenibacillus peoriae]|uniref:SIR2 family protein n=1 Tax=Paenibacillus peoriae TaxID=59893 RepID=UPI0006A71D0D|nr:SIR2 family protein [Paenibacillus peoriae]ALA40211.1 hypothetical protein ABE82_01040 [Paenibacillus peoriae]
MEYFSLSILALDEAINQIKQVSDDYFTMNKMSPYFFMVGAGISYPSAPLAKDIIEHCKDKASRHGRSLDENQVNNSTQNEYSEWFELAYPNRQQRQNYLKELIHNRTISMANIKLAHILSNSKLTNLVITTNFDDFLSRSLNVFGIPHIVSDHPHTVEKINTDSEYVQIVHIHGTYWFYDCCNLQSEIIERAERSLQSNLTMSFFIDSLLYRRVPIIVGYSGWENDVFMQALKRRLQSPLPYNLYWFCYSKESLELIPDWIKKNSDIKFVLPLESNIDEKYEEKETTEIIQKINAINYIGNNKKKDVLSAELVFEHFINVFNIESPQITRDPIGFFTQSLKKSFENNNAGNSDNKYFLEDVIGRLERVKESKEYNINIFIEDLKELVKKSQYKEVIIKVNKEYNYSSFSLDEHRQLLSVILDAATNISDEIEGFQLVRSISNKLLIHTDSIWVREFAYKSLLGMGKNNSDSKRYKEALNCFNQVIETNNFNELKLLKVDALLNKAFTYDSLGQNEEEIKLYDFIIETYGDEDDIKIKRKVAQSLFNKVSSCFDHQEDGEVLENSDNLVIIYNTEKDTYIQDFIDRAILFKTLTYLKQGLYDEAIFEVDRVITKHDLNKDNKSQKFIAIGLRIKGLILRADDRHKEALGVYDELASRFKDVEELTLKEFAAGAMIDKAQYLDKMGNHEEAIKIYEGVIIDYAEIDEFSEKAVLSKANSFIQIGNFEEAIFLFDRIIEENSDINVTNLEYVATAYLNKGLALGKNNQDELAITTYTQLNEKIGGRNELRAKEYWASSMLGLAASYRALNYYDRIIICYDKIIQELKSYNELNIKKIVASALFSKASFLSSRDEHRESREIFHNIFLKLREEEDKELQLYGIKALMNEGKIYIIENSHEKALKTFELLEKRALNSKYVEVKSYCYHSIIERASVVLEFNKDYKRAFNLLKGIEADIKRLSKDDELYKRYGAHMVTVGYNAYKIGKDSELAKEIFLVSFNMNNSLSGINLAYMLRRGEIIAEGLPSIPKLLEEGLEEIDPFAVINKIIIDLEDNNEDATWRKCDQLISLIEETEGIMQWWKEIATNGEAEGHLVIGWLCRNKGIADPEGLTFAERFSMARDLGINVPSWLEQ